MRGYFITFEGGEGSGKSTQIQLAADYLRQQGHEVVITKEPRGKIREVLLSPESSLVPLTEVFLFYADRMQHCHEVIIPALEQGKIVLSDRHNDSTLAYQQYGRQLDPALFSTLTSLLPLSPNLTILLDVPVEVGLARSTKTEFGQKDRFEGEVLAFHERLRQGYLDLAKKHPERIKVVNAEPAEDDVHAHIVGLLQDLLD